MVNSNFFLVILINVFFGVRKGGGDELVEMNLNVKFSDVRIGQQRFSQNRNRNMTFVPMHSSYY